MSWGTIYTYDGYLSRISKDELYSKKEELQDLIDMTWRDILAYMSATPPAMMKDEEGNEYPYPEFMAMKVREMRQKLEDDVRLLERIENCLETLKEHPENVEEG